jgi:CBS domain-containing protein
MKTVAQMLKLKRAGVISIGPNVPVLDALKLLAEKDIGAVLVMDGPRLVGVLSSATTRERSRSKASPKAIPR